MLSRLETRGPWYPRVMGRWISAAAVLLIACGGDEQDRPDAATDAGRGAVDGGSIDGGAFIDAGVNEDGGLPAEDAGPVSACDDAANLQVVAFNIRFDDGSPSFSPDAWDSAVLDDRRDRTIDVIRDMDPDLLGTQEARKPQVDDLTAALTEYGFVGVGRDDGDEGGEYAGIFYRSARFTALGSGHFWLSDTPETPGTVFDCSGSVRMATWIRLRDDIAGRELVVLNTHWDNACQASREQSATLIRQRLGTLAGDTPIILTGDLNQSAGNVAVRTLFDPPDDPQLIDGYRQAVPIEDSEEATFHGFDGRVTGDRIDYVLHDADFETIAASIVRTTYGDRYPSDHYPVTGTLAWTSDARGAPCP